MKNRIIILGIAIILFILWKVLSGGDSSAVGVPQSEEEKIAQVKAKLQSDLLSTYKEDNAIGGGEEDAAMDKFERILSEGVDIEEEDTLVMKKIELKPIALSTPDVVAPPVDVPAQMDNKPQTMAEMAAAPTDAYESALVAEVDIAPTVAPVQKTVLKHEVLKQEETAVGVSTVSLKGKKIRDRLKTLLAKAEKTLNEPTDVMPVGESKGANAVSITPKSARGMLHDLVSMAMNSGSEKDTRYVESLLGEVGKAKIKVVGVNKNFTTIQVKVGDTLWKMAHNFYGDGFKYPVIYNANRDVINNPSSISPGMIIKIPKL